MARKGVPQPHAPAARGGAAHTDVRSPATPPPPAGTPPARPPPHGGRRGWQQPRPMLRLPRRSRTARPGRGGGRAGRPLCSVRAGVRRVCADALGVSATPRGAKRGCRRRPPGGAERESARKKYGRGRGSPHRGFAVVRAAARGVVGAGDCVCVCVFSLARHVPRTSPPGPVRLRDGDGPGQCVCVCVCVHVAVRSSAGCAQLRDKTHHLCFFSLALTLNLRSLPLSFSGLCRSRWPGSPPPGVGPRRPARGRLRCCWPAG